MPAYVGVYRGTIVSTSDPLANGRMQVMIPALGGQISSWAPVCGSFVPLNMTPRVGGGVWVAFEAGDPTRPVVMGSAM